MINLIIKASSRYPIRRKRIKKKIEEVLVSFEINGEVEVELNIIGDRKMRQLKNKFLGIDETTDVLSFPLQENILKNKEVRTSDKTDSRYRHLRVASGMTQGIENENDFVEYPDGVLRLGTIFISYSQAQRQANLHKLIVDDEIDQLVEHGMMHLVGIHHE